MSLTHTQQLSEDLKFLGRVSLKYFTPLDLRIYQTRRPRQTIKNYAGHIRNVRRAVEKRIREDGGPVIKKQPHPSEPGPEREIDSSERAGPLQGTPRLPPGHTCVLCLDPYCPYNCGPERHRHRHWTCNEAPIYPPISAEERREMKDKAFRSAFSGPLKEFEIWCEGFAATGQSGRHHLVGVSPGTSFADACNRFFIRSPDGKLHYDPKTLTYWGCRLFDNATDAAKAFG